MCLVPLTSSFLDFRTHMCTCTEYLCVPLPLSTSSHTLLMPLVQCAICGTYSYSFGGPFWGFGTAALRLVGWLWAWPSLHPPSPQECCWQTQRPLEGLWAWGRKRGEEGQRWWGRERSGAPMCSNSELPSPPFILYMYIHVRMQIHIRVHIRISTAMVARI